MRLHREMSVGERHQAGLPKITMEWLPRNLTRVKADGYSRNRVRRYWPLKCIPENGMKKSGTAEDINAFVSFVIKG